MTADHLRALAAELRASAEDAAEGAAAGDGMARLATRSSDEERGECAARRLRASARRLRALASTLEVEARLLG
jgi:hypothetical protein